MILLNIAQLFEIKGIQNATTKMLNAGISHGVVVGYLNGKRKSIQLKDIEVLCEILNCGPAELFAWEPQKGTTPPENHPLQSIRKRKRPSLNELVKDLSPAEIEARLKQPVQ